MTRGEPQPAACRSAWRAGWLRGARRIVSPNFGPRPDATAIDLVVIHSISLPPGQFGGDAIERLFMNRLDPAAHRSFEAVAGLRVSAHFLVRRDGSLIQFVSCDERAWHAGVSAWRGRSDCNDFSIGIELEGREGDRFESAQYERLGATLASIAAHYPIRAVVGHEHVAPGRKNDPGPGFDWAELERRVHALRLDFVP